MDLYQAIDELRRERETVIRLIAAFEAIQSGASPVRSKRGRKSMDRKGRQEVSERMKRYWAARRAKGEGGDDSGQVAKLPEFGADSPSHALEAAA